MILEVKVTHLCLTLCDPMYYRVHGILRARILEWVAFPFSRGSSQPRDRTQVSCIAGGYFTSWATREAPKWSSVIWKWLLSVTVRKMQVKTVMRYCSQPSDLQKFESLAVYSVQEVLSYIVVRIAKLFTTKRREVGNFS